MSGGHVDILSYVNHNIEKYNEKYHTDKPYAIGFEVDEKNKNRIRFFDDDGKTVWLPDKMYENLNKTMIKNRSFRERYVSESWKQIASGNYTDIALLIQQKIKSFKKRIALNIKKVFGRSR